MKVRVCLRNLIREEHGVATALLALFLVCLLVGAAFALDLGRVWVEKGRLQKCVDAAVLAGACHLYDSPEDVDDTVREYYEANGRSSAEITRIEPRKISDGEMTLTVEAVSTVPYSFAPVIGKYSGRAKAVATARLSAVTELPGGKGVVPLGITGDELAWVKEHPNEPLIIKKSDGAAGNFGPLSMFGSGADNYGENLILGCIRTVRVGDRFYTETGNMSGPTINAINGGGLPNVRDQGFVKCRLDRCRDLCGSGAYSDDPALHNKNCPRFVYIPVIDYICDPATGEPVKDSGRYLAQIEGFAYFFLTNLEASPQPGNECRIYGKFLNKFEKEETGGGSLEYGLWHLKLIQ